MSQGYPSGGPIVKRPLMGGPRRPIPQQLRGAPQMIEPSLTPDPRVRRWLQRHPHPTSFILHMIGIPPTFLGALFVPIYLCRLSWTLFFLALGLFVGGYLLQFAGHLLEGTDPGEIIYFKRKMGLAYVEFPRPRPARPRRPSGAPVPSA